MPRYRRHQALGSSSIGSVGIDLVSSPASSTIPNCLLCVFPLHDITSVPCAHDGLICATCAVKITRHLAAPRCCPFCMVLLLLGCLFPTIFVGKTEWPDLVIDKFNDSKPYDQYNSVQGMLTIDSVMARSPSKELVSEVWV